LPVQLISEDSKHDIGCSGTTPQLNQWSNIDLKEMVQNKGQDDQVQPVIPPAEQVKEKPVKLSKLPWVKGPMKFVNIGADVDEEKP